MTSEIAVRLWIFAIMNAGRPGDTQHHEKNDGEYRPHHGLPR